MLPSSVRSALDVKNAIESAPTTLQAIGKCVTAVDTFKRQYRQNSDQSSDQSDEDASDQGECSGREAGEDNGDEEGEDNANEEAEDNRSDRGEEGESNVPTPKNKELAQQLSGIYKTYKVVWSSKLKPFKLTVKRPGCEFDGEVSTGYRSEYDSEHIRGKDGGLLKKWHDNAPQAGFGDMRAQETRVDLTVRNAHEIKRDEFEVEDGLLEKIASLWGEHFFPAHVRVEPYKINVYGPGGHFKPHKDTPEKDLVGTFLIGLGQTTYDTNLVVAGKGFDAYPLDWVAFYPDVVHEVQPVEGGYRAMLAFKVFHLDGAGAEPAPTDSLRAGGHALLAPLVKQLRAPFGLLFQRQYGISTTELSGLDAVLLDCARERAAQSGGALEVRVLPVLTHLSGSATMDDWGGAEVDVGANVFPLTDAHVDILVGRGVDEAKEKVAWLKGVAHVPFFAIESMASCGEAWRHEEGDDTEYRGNEARAAHEDSIYLSFAMMVLPSRGRKRCASAGADSEPSSQSKRITVT